MDSCFSTNCIELVVGCKLYQSNTTIPLETGFYSDGTYCYEVTNGIIISVTTCTQPSASVGCSGVINVSGEGGVYKLTIDVGTGLGLTGIKYYSQNVPDRFQIMYDGVMVGDSKYVGNHIIGGQLVHPGINYSSPFYGWKYLNVINYDMTLHRFVNSGVQYPPFEVQQSDLGYPSNGVGCVMFNKTTAYPTTFEVTITGVLAGTDWDLEGLCPRLQSQITPNLVPMIVNAFFSVPSDDVPATTLRIYVDEYQKYSNSITQVFTTPIGSGTTASPYPYWEGFSNTGWSDLKPFIYDPGDLGAIKLDYKGMVLPYTP